MIHLAIAAPAVSGFALLLLAMARHQQDWLSRKLAPRTSHLLRTGGLSALALAFAAAGLGLGWAYGTLAWFGWLSASAMVVLATQTNRDRILRLFS